MSIKGWMSQNTHDLVGKTVAMTGTTGGLGCELCQYLLSLNAKLIMLDRNQQKAKALEDKLKAQFPNAQISRIEVDLESIDSVKSATEQLKQLPIDIFIHNAGAYSIPRKVCKTGFDNVFQINFVSPYYMIKQLLPNLRLAGGRVVAVGSIAHNYSKIDPDDIDFAKRTASSKVYGNAKRYLMFSLFELFKNETDVTLSVVHPGITFTNITAHYPKLIFAVIKHPMKIIFMKPRRAALSILKGAFESTEYHEWIGPWVFNVWGLPNKNKLKTCSDEESQRIFTVAEDIYEQIK